MAHADAGDNAFGKCGASDRVDQWNDREQPSVRKSCIRQQAFQDRGRNGKLPATCCKSFTTKKPLGGENLHAM
jgi:hypothetical protein